VNSRNLQELNVNIRNHKVKIFFCWIIVLLSTRFMFGCFYGTTPLGLSDNGPSAPQFVFLEIKSMARCFWEHGPKNKEVNRRRKLI